PPVPGIHTLPLHAALPILPHRAGRISAGPSALALGNWYPTLAPHRGAWDRHQYSEVGDAFVTEVADFDVRLSTSIPLVVASSGRSEEHTSELQSLAYLVCR